MNHSVFLNFYFGAKNARNSLVVRRVSQDRIIIVLFWTRYAFPRQIKIEILKLTTSRGQRNFQTVFIFVSREEKGCYRFVSLGHQNIDCWSFAGSAAVCKAVIDHRRRQNVVRTSVTHSGIALCATFLLLPHFDFVCDLLLNRRSATWNLFVKYCIISQKA